MVIRLMLPKGTARTLPIRSWLDATPAVEAMPSKAEVRERARDVYHARPPSEAEKSSSLSSLSPSPVAFLHVLFLHLASIFFRWLHLTTMHDTSHAWFTVMVFTSLFGLAQTVRPWDPKSPVRKWKSCSNATQLNFFLLVSCFLTYLITICVFFALWVALERPASQHLFF
jgi:hypothetical protein